MWSAGHYSLLMTVEEGRDLENDHIKWIQPLRFYQKICYHPRPKRHMLVNLHIIMSHNSLKHANSHMLVNLHIIMRHNSLKRANSNMVGRWHTHLSISCSKIDLYHVNPPFKSYIMNTSRKLDTVYRLPDKYVKIIDRILTQTSYRLLLQACHMK